MVQRRPFLNVVASSLSNNSAVSRGRVSFYPIGFNLEAYKAVVRYQHIWTGYKNTILYTVIGTGINLLMTIAGAYPLSRGIRSSPISEYLTSVPPTSKTASSIYLLLS